eukprot:GEMP01042097.1.p1 GENE.GEMP01042097.1~~GEMP01042097.1.p1  ORF type:complete len:386 (+),score=88.61 GEMP01042097.1:207-1364(+)
MGFCVSKLGSKASEGEAPASTTDKTAVDGEAGSTDVSMDAIEIDIADTGVMLRKSRTFPHSSTTTLFNVDGEDGGSANGEIGLRAKKYCIKMSDLRELLVSMMPTDEQLAFFDSWVECLGGQEQHFSTRLSFHTDGSNLEYGVRGSCDKLVGMIKKFLIQCEIPLDPFESMTRNIQELQCVDMTFWCKIKHLQPRTACRNDEFTPGIDAGYVLHCAVPWGTADIIMPQVDDQDNIRDHMHKEGRSPCGIGASLVPVEPESRIVFHLEGTGTSKKGLMAMFVFFRSMGFPKPEEEVVRLLSSTAPSGYLIVVHIGPEGLTCLTATLESPKRLVYEEICTEINFTCCAKYVVHAQSICGGEFTGLEYSSSARGYTVGLVFEAEPPDA